MDKRKIIILSFLVMAVAGLTLSSAFALDVPTKYKTKVFTNKYYPSDKIYSDGQYVWLPKVANFCDYTIQEKRYSANKVKISYYIYNNNGKYKWTDVRSSKLTVKYKIKTRYHTYYKTKVVKYTKIPIYGANKRLILKSPKGSKITIYYMKWTQVQRLWYG